MKLGTIAYDNEIYNLDYMTASEIKEIINIIESNKLEKMNHEKKID